jgi:catechol 2,3-dioxygenase-like lactoylglutathione lyase family enzyme
MIRVKLISIIVDDQAKARSFYTEKLGFRIKHDVPVGDANWLTVVPPDDPDGVQVLLEPASVPEAAALQKALHKEGTPLTQLYTSDLRREYEALKGRGVVFKGQPERMGPTLYADFDDTCGNFIRLVEG